MINWRPFNVPITCAAKAADTASVTYHPISRSVANPIRQKAALTRKAASISAMASAACAAAGPGRHLSTSTTQPAAIPSDASSISQPSRSAPGWSSRRALTMNTANTAMAQPASARAPHCAPGGRPALTSTHMRAVAMGIASRNGAARYHRSPSLSAFAGDVLHANGSQMAATPATLSRAAAMSSGDQRARAAPADDVLAMEPSSSLP